MAEDKGKQSTDTTQSDNGDNQKAETDNVQKLTEQNIPGQSLEQKEELDQQKAIQGEVQHMMKNEPQGSQAPQVPGETPKKKRRRRRRKKKSAQGLDQNELNKNGSTKPIQPKKSIRELQGKPEKKPEKKEESSPQPTKKPEVLKEPQPPQESRSSKEPQLSKKPEPTKEPQQPFKEQDKPRDFQEKTSVPPPRQRENEEQTRVIRGSMPLPKNPEEAQKEPQKVQEELPKVEPPEAEPPKIEEKQPPAEEAPTGPFWPGSVSEEPGKLLVPEQEEEQKISDTVSTESEEEHPTPPWDHEKEEEENEPRPMVTLGEGEEEQKEESDETESEQEAQPEQKGPPSFTQEYAPKEPSEVEDKDLTDEPEPTPAPTVEPEPVTTPEEETPPKEEAEIRIGPQEEQPPPVPVGRLREDAPYIRSDEPEKIQTQDQSDTETESEDVGETDQEAPWEKKDSVSKKPGLKEVIEEHQKEEQKGGKIPEVEDAQLSEKKSPFKAILDALERAWPLISAAINLRIIGALVAVILLGWGIFFIYTQGYVQRLVGYVGGFFSPAPPQTPVQIIPLTDQELRQYGFAGAFLFGDNNGSIYDRTPEEIVVASFFGELREPKIAGETGITSAYFYGELHDLGGSADQFVAYVDNLEQLRNLYKIDVYAMLDQVTDRSGKLSNYMDDLKAAQGKSKEIESSIHLNIDDMESSFNSLNPDKQKYEADFFASLDQLQAEKSDAILKNFVDASQKQVALKARVAGLQKLAAYYKTALERLATRIEVVEKNTAALVQGIHVVDVPGEDLDIIIQTN